MTADQSHRRLLATGGKSATLLPVTRSVAAQPPRHTIVDITNESTRPVQARWSILNPSLLLTRIYFCQVAWVNFEGRETNPEQILPNEKFRHQTRNGHAFAARNEHGAPILVYVFLPFAQERLTKSHREICTLQLYPFFGYRDWASNCHQNVWL